MRVFVLCAALVGAEPRAEVSKSRCARSQHENRRDRIIFGAAARREIQPFMYIAARKRTWIYKLRTVLTFSE